MQPTLHHAATALDELTAALWRDGYVIVERLAPELAAHAMHELHDAIEAAPLGATAFTGERTKRVGALLRRSLAVRELAVHPVVLALADQVLQPYCARYQLNFSGIMHLLPGATAQVLHRDGDLYPFPFPCPPTNLSTMWALSDFTADNGGTQVVPGSHEWEESREPFADEIVAAAMPAGSVLIYLSGTVHGGGTNSSAATRTGLALQYSLGWLRQEENQYLTNPPEVARTFSEQLQRLIGYDYGGPYLGFVNGDTAQRLLVDDYQGPPERSNAEVDALAARMFRLRWGNMEARPTPSRVGTTVPTNKGPIVT
ncbi:MAG: Phytanoyl-CoA dioxygenase [Ilumatobacteraceae bacterium]|nr:Phytanoyl-CoA dioxygenase [Ilumatobacteraceae bacterium]